MMKLSGTDQPDERCSKNSFEAGLERRGNDLRSACLGTCFPLRVLSIGRHRHVDLDHENAILECLDGNL
ncbi:hypothetical protein, partial [Pontitalea aquivivens]|uniref:hypothetical protein n=1 Tax=Pontitalea aquivivens TaxID=3388663 RepID=UPI003970ED41